MLGIVLFQLPIGQPELISRPSAIPLHGAGIQATIFAPGSLGFNVTIRLMATRAVADCRDGRSSTDQCGRILLV
ncbi:hypothetical protein BDP55DRAFT_123847 [Colletotrichum godetiae]|uniref:Uncharacterized protein n=1 Tax=Colletotrichum godetiae TaxID=1209918 RepID=A0AAJ0F224_9PEZI|nr:uncharacterized protein BDP55DRAFT_123847 [Colletotrichum godetiae]KAK1700259.1 hypothetical protein BDP55DRAFT_123847 [Colletotrichum godetiae]